MSHVLDAILEQAWAITPQALEAILGLAQRIEASADPRVFHASGQTEPEALLAIGGERLEGARRAVLRQRSAIIPVMGPIFPRSNLMTDYSGATSVESVARDLQLALESDEVDSIILNIDSPGGAVTGTGELADRIYAARDIKPVVAYVFGSAASGAYWLASAASDIVATDTAVLGSIGVVAAYLDTREKDQRAGVKAIEVVSSVSPRKRPDITTDEGRAQIQRLVDDLAGVFVRSVARNRDIAESDVLARFGQGDVLVAAKAIEAGMANRIGSLEALVAEVNDRSTNLMTGGILMSAALRQGSEPAAVSTVTVEAVRDNSPDTYRAIMEAGRKEGLVAGATAERDRIAGILALKAPGFEAFVSESALQAEQTAGTVAAAILAKQEDRRQKQAAAIGADAAVVAEQAAKVQTQSETPAVNVPAEKEAAEQEAVVKGMVAGGNARRMK